MLPVERCPCCDGAATEGWPGLVAPFIADFVLHQPVGPCTLVECPHCGFRFFDLRFEEGELATLYSAYRGPAYFEVRHRHEWWYTRRINDRHDSEGSTTRLRRSHLVDFVGRRLPTPLRRVLDYGGDAGQLLSPALGEVLHVFEMSGIQPVPGVKRIEREADLEAGSYDLVVLSHVLEHVPDVAGLLGKLRTLLKPGGHLYIEVPWERYRMPPPRRGSTTRRYLSWLATHPFLLRVMDFYSTSVRVFLDALPPGGFPKLHEHLNFFNKEGMNALLARMALTSEAIEVVRLPLEGGGLQVLSVLAKAPDT